MSTQFSFVLNKVLSPKKTILLVSNPNEFDFRLSSNMSDFTFFTYTSQELKWNYTKYIPPENLVMFSNKSYVLFNDISLIIGSHGLETADFKNKFPYLPLISIFHNEPVKDIPFFPSIEKKNYGKLCLSTNKKVSDSWQNNGKVVQDFNTKSLVKEVKEFYESIFNKKHV